VALGFWVVFGRLFCGSVCPVGFLQDLFNKIPFPIKIKSFKADRYLRYIKYVAVLVPLVLMLFGFSQNMDRKTPPESLVVMLSFAIIAGLICIMISRPFCKYVCWVGAISGLGNKISFYKYKINKEKCLNCSLCSKACPMDIEPRKINALECIRCGRCKKSCPSNAIAWGFGKNQ
jgi:polyferredoxin